MVPQVSIKLKGAGLGDVSDFDGKWEISDVPFGTYTLVIAHPKYDYFEKEVTLSKEDSSLTLEITLLDNPLLVDQVVVTATRTDKRKTDAPVIVGVINSKTLENVQACTLSDGLKFQPGLRVETDCQTCNYTQLRMNGLAGGYSQILINGRPIFSPLTGLYGLEQIPTNMIDRIEVVRGGGSALFGSSAIGGTVNVITKLPRKNDYSISNNTQFLGNGSIDNIIAGNATLVSDNKNSGISFFVNNRNRGMYDHNSDNYSEITAQRNLSFGTNMFFLPTENQKIELSFSRLHEYRYGGEMVEGPAHLAQQSEERTHDVYIGSLDYQINFNDGKSSLILYTAGQYTDRDHYTGVLPDDSTELLTHFLDPPYGTSQVTTLQVGTQFNQKVKAFPFGENVFTVGTEYVYDDVLDVIPAYDYVIDQTTRNLGVFAQSDWEIKRNLQLLLGARADQHNFLDAPVVSPRTSLMYTIKDALQLRVGWARGFRAPQAFDSDMHIAFAGGGISRITLDDNLIEERSNSYTTSVNYDKRGKKFIAGFTLEGFYTELDNAFYYHPLGEDAFGELFEKRNGDGATVVGTSLELRLNWQNEVEIESGFTLQESTFDSPVLYSDVLERTDVFLRTPNTYGYANLFLWPKRQFNASISSVYTGPMTVLHLAGAPEQPNDAFVTSPSFFEISARLSYNLKLPNIKAAMQFFGGVKNILNAYQNDFDTGKNRDSNFVYGPAQPRTVYIGLKLSSL
ncbi:MAG: TonB-dependent receptor [Crocinitomicaceae bacterium]